MTKSARSRGADRLVRRVRLYLGVSLSLLGVIALLSCRAAGDKKLEAAKTLIAADPNLEIVATDERAGVITVKVKSTGQITVLKAEDVQVGKLLPGAGSEQRADGGPGTGQASAGDDSLVVSGPGGSVKLDGKSGSIIASGKDGSEVRVGGSGDGVQIDAPGAKVRLGGDGEEGAVEGGDPDPDVTVSAGGGSRTRKIRRRQAEPVICGPDRTMRLEGVRVEVPGDAVTADEGCTLVIVDSEIVADGWAVVTRGAADVIIENCLIDGRKGAVSAGGGGDVTAKSSTFRGRIAQSGGGDFNDLGGNEKLPGR
jgi:hypothetical protein